MKPAILEKHWRDALTTCPCCGMGIREENTPDDGIPDGQAVEFVYTCGAAVFIGTSGNASPGRACPAPLDVAIDDLAHRVHDAVEEEEAADEAA
ncbi:hypothetical protein SAMN04515666_101317 [Bosea lupini]|uniref:Uncharacterized protein n=1 Tax=Bosea lupini TaxID=1036779 RepID=A0A1H7GFY8_9HYPH|nr:hypothetical protein [Bosea lupini]SEK35822.1 hypothetical protein SAMN04515666_101317 [Bosea lupini]